MTAHGLIMIVDDDLSIRETMDMHFRSSGFDVVAVDSAEAALQQLGRLDPLVLLTDVRMSGMNGIELLRVIRERRADLPVIVMTAFEDMQTAMGAMREGAYDFLVKPLDLDTIDRVVQRCLADQRLQRRMAHLHAKAAEPYALSQLVGRDPVMIELYKTVGRIARTRTPVLIRGETGTGKEVVARAIHFNGPDAQEPFVAVNCTSLSESLLESELFGHVRGAFTGATSDRKGYFAQAGRGTVFLDEIGDISPAFQAKLLRILQEKEFSPVGGERVMRTDARVVAATHRPLAELVASGQFREDLYFRLRVVELHLPPLRQRRGDIPLLAEHLLRRAETEMHRTGTQIAPGALRALAEHRWPGNVRELEHAITRALVLTPGSVITEDMLGLERLGVTPASGEVAANRSAEDLTLRGAEQAHVLRVLAIAGGNKRKAARLLGVSRPRLDRILGAERTQADLEPPAGGIES